MAGVHPDLLQVLKKALAITKIDFAVIDGVRTKTEQKAMVKKGLSQTMNSKHLEQKDGYGHAIDLAPYFNGKIRWEMMLFFDVAEAMFMAAEEHGVELIWGGAWTEHHEQYEHTTDKDLFRSAEFMQHKYMRKRNRANQKIFLDGAHFQLR